MSKLGRLLDEPIARLLLLAAAWLASYALYFVVLARPYYLGAYLWTPKLSTGVIAERQAGPALSFVLGFVLLFALWAGAYWLVRGLRAPELLIAIGLCGLVLAVLLVQVYPIGANDVFGYITAGELLAFHGLNPMVHPPNHVPNLPLAEYSVYAGMMPNYGPVWTWVEGAVAWIVGVPHLLRLTMGFKVVAVLGYVATCLVLVLVLRRRAPDRLAAGLLAFAWNPLVLFEVAVNAHNDVWIGLLVLAGVLCWDTGHRLWMVVALTLAALIKVPVGVVLPLFVVAAWRQEPGTARRMQFLWSAALVALAIIIVSYLSLPEGWKGLANLASRTDLFTDSLPAVVRHALELALPQRTAMGVAGVLTIAVFAGYTLLQLFNAWQAPAQAVRLGFNLLLLLLLVCMTWFQPWYLLWIVPLAAVYPRPNALFQVGLFGLCATWSYIIFGFVWFWLPRRGIWGRGLGIELLAAISTYLLSWTYAAWSARRARRADLPTPAQS